MEPVEAQENLDRIEELVQRLKIDFDRFFNGALPSPPETLRYKAFAEVRKMRTEHHKSAAVRFRMNSLEAKLNSLSELFNRRLRELEMGAARRSRAAFEAGEQKHDPYGGVVINSKAEKSAVQSLYGELYGKGKRSTQTDLASFRGFLIQQVATIQEKTGCKDVVFRISSDKGKVRLRAKPGKTGTGNK